jgi:hypothetical protein
MLLKEIMNPNCDAKKLKRHVNSLTDKSESDEISRRLIAKGINPTPRNIKFYLQLFSESA